MEDVLVPIAGIVGAFSFPLFLLWVILEMRKANHRNKENMALISQGIIPETTVKPKATPNRFVSLRNGIVLVGIAVGILVGFGISEGMKLHEEQAFWIYSACILLFLGIGYLIYFFATQNMKLPSDNENDFTQR